MRKESEIKQANTSIRVYLVDQSMFMVYGKQASSVVGALLLQQEIREEEVDTRIKIENQDHDFQQQSIIHSI